MALNDLYMERIIREVSSILDQNERFSRNASNYGYSLAQGFERDFRATNTNPQEAQEESGKGLRGRIIARPLTEVPEVELPPEPPEWDLNDFYNSELFGRIPQFYDIIKEQRDDYIQEFFPDCFNKLSVMCDWLEDVIANGYSGLPAHIEDAIWNRDRSRVDLEYRSAADEYFADHASRGFPMPSGPLARQLDKLSNDRTNAIAVSSREAAIKQYETAIETVKFAVRTSADLYIALHKIVDDVVKNATAIVLGAMDNTHKMAQAIAALYGVQVAYYQALESWHKLQMSHDVPQGELDLRADQTNQALDYQLMKDWIEVANTKATNMADMVQSALGSLQTITLNEESTSN